MNRRWDVENRLTNGFFVGLWLLSRPFVWVYSLLHWFVLAVAKETGNKVVKIVGGVIAVSLVGFVVGYFLH